jgi:hypothetical protein
MHPATLIGGIGLDSLIDLRDFKNFLIKQMHWEIIPMVILLKIGVKFLVVPGVVVVNIDPEITTLHYSFCQV